MHGYWHATRHPWPCLLFVLPLLFLYEGYMLWHAMEGHTPARAGLDAWIFSSLLASGTPVEYLPSLLLAGVCISWAILKWDRSPPETLSTWAGIGLESIVYALALWGLGALVATGVRELGVPGKVNLAMTYLGCGIYEEVLFRLLFFGGLVWLFKLVADARVAVGVAILLSAVGFALAHVIGPHGEPWHLRSFLFRTLAGVVFAGLLTARGLGITVGTHCAYNLFVGLHD